MFIWSNNISVIIKGKFDEKTVTSCKSIRKYLPKAQIIVVSEAEDETGNTALYDKFVLIDDVGADKFPLQDFKQINVKRQIYSVQKGLEAAKRKYVLIIRSDLELLGNDFLKYFDILKKTNSDYKIFDKRILVSMIQHSYKSNWLFFPNDWIYFGLRKDINKLFDIPYDTDENNAYFIDTAPSKKEIYESLTERDKKIFTMRYWSEQYVFFHCIKKYAKNVPDFKDWTDINDETRISSELFLLNNFLVLDYGEIFQIRINKLPNYSEENIKLVMSTSYGFNEFIDLHRYRIEPKYKFPYLFKRFLKRKNQA